MLTIKMYGNKKFNVCVCLYIYVLYINIWVYMCIYIYMFGIANDTNRQIKL